MDKPLAEDVSAILHDHIRSWEQLEILLLLHANRSEAWSAESVANRMRLGVELSLRTLEHLSKQRLVESSEDDTRRFWFGPGDPTLDETVGRLAEAYRERQVEVLKILTTDAVDRVRSAAMETFSESLLLGRKRTP